MSTERDYPEDVKRCIACWIESGHAPDGGLMPWGEYCEHLRAGGLRRPRKRRARPVPIEAPSEPEPQEDLF